MIIKESNLNINRYLYQFDEQIPSYIGEKGPLTTSDLDKLETLMDSSIINQWYSELSWYNGDDINDYFDELTKDTVFNEIYQQYYKSMGRRRDGSQLDIISFFKYLDNYAYIYVFNDSYLIGQMQNGLFHISHFAPKSLRGGMDILNDIASYNNIVFAVTDDLGPMLQKIGLYGDSKAVVPMFFRNMLVLKHIYTTDKRLINSLLSTLQNTKDIEDLQNNLSDSMNDIDLNEKPQKNDNSDMYSSSRIPMNYKIPHKKGFEYDDSDRDIDKFYHHYAIMVYDDYQECYKIIGYCDSIKDIPSKTKKIKTGQYSDSPLYLFDYYKNKMTDL